MKKSIVAILIVWGILFCTVEAAAQTPPLPPAEEKKPATPAPPAPPKPEEKKPAPPTPPAPPKPEEKKPAPPTPASQKPAPIAPASPTPPKPEEKKPAPAPTPPPTPPKPEAPVYAPKPVVVSEKSLSQSDRDNIERAAPWQPIIKPQKPRKLLVFDLNVDYGGHRSIVQANHALTLLGNRTKAWETVVSHDPQAFEAENLKKFDAVVFNNTVGNVFADPTLRKNLEEFVKNGGGLLAIHGATAAFVHWDGDKKGQDDWPTFGEIIGARGTKHREPDERITVRVDDKEHPLAQFFPKDGFIYRDEFFRVDNPYSRQKQRVLLSIDNGRSHLNRPPYGDRKERPDEDYALVWVKNYGNGRVCYSTFGHGSKIFWDPMMLKFYLAATQFVLGDLEASTAPSAPPAQ